MTVPRETPREVAMRFMPALEQAIFYGWKTETRRPLRPKNSTLTRGEWDEIDWASGRPDLMYPTSSLRARFQAGDSRRTTCVAPRIRPGAILWPRIGQAGDGAKKENARVRMRVVQVQAVRLCDLSELEAHAEGIRVFAPSCRPTYEANADQIETTTIGEEGHSFTPGMWNWDANLEAVHAPKFAAEAYAFLLEQLGKLSAKRWRAGPVHQDIVGRDPSARDAFALLWDSINGVGSWGRNPWVWRYVFETVLPEPAAQDSPALRQWIEQRGKLGEVAE